MTTIGAPKGKRKKYVQSTHLVSTPPHHKRRARSNVQLLPPWGFTSWKRTHVDNRVEPIIYQANLSSHCLASSQNYSEPNQGIGITKSPEGWSESKL